MSETLNTYGRELAIEQVIQFFFDEQWCASERAIAQNERSASWATSRSSSATTVPMCGRNPEVFELDDERRPLRVSGVPPDYFSVTGQRWGNPLYKWQAARGARLRLVGGTDSPLAHALRHDPARSLPRLRGVLVDSCRRRDGGQRSLGEGSGASSSSSGLKEVFGELPFVAEDLGLITPEVDELREHFQMPGMRVLQFGFSDRGSHLHLPQSFVPNTVVYTGTHDNNTTLGMVARRMQAELERTHLQTYLQPIRHEGEVVWAMMRAAARSVANICIFPLQDVLHLGSEARMNIPAASRRKLVVAIRLGCAASGLRRPAGGVDGDDGPRRLCSAGAGADSRSSAHAAEAGPEHLDWKGNLKLRSIHASLWRSHPYHELR